MNVSLVTIGDNRYTWRLFSAAGVGGEATESAAGAISIFFQCNL